MTIGLFIGVFPSLISYEGMASLALPVVRQLVQLRPSGGSGRWRSLQECVMIKAGGSSVCSTRPRHKIRDLLNPGL